MEVKDLGTLNPGFEGVNFQLHKELNPKIGIIYGDGCQYSKIKEIWTQLEGLGFAADTILFGVGAFSFSAMCTPEDGMVCLTRDTFGFAMKSTYCVIDGKEYTIQKNPKTDKNNLKKSHKGLCCVVKEENKFVCHDGYAEDTMPEENELKLVFKDGELVKEQTLEDAVEQTIRECMEEDVMADFLKRNRAEVVKMCLYEYDEEKQREFDREEGREEGREEERQNTLREKARADEEKLRADEAFRKIAILEKQLAELMK